MDGTEGEGQIGMKGQNEFDRLQEAKGFPTVPPPYDWDQAGEVAEIVGAVMQAAIKSTWEAAEAMEARERTESLRTIRTAQGVGIVLEAMLHAFQTNLHAYGAPCEEAAQASAFYYLEDF